MSDILIIGGGLAGLTSALVLANAGFEVTVVEKKQYPFHRVCGEYVSNEVKPFLKGLGVDVNELQPSCLTHLAVSTVSGKLLEAPLDLGGFGISRYAFDHFLYQKARSAGVQFMLGSKVNDIRFDENKFCASLANSTELIAPIAICAFGKRSNLDQKLNRSFFYRRSRYMGVKYHIRSDFPQHIIQLDNFEGGYCGICKIEGDRYSLCYLTETRNLKKYGSIAEMEQQVLYRNLRLKHHFTQSEFVFEKPEVINEITFERKSLAENHLLFCGDAAGMITPLCGNGMAMAIHSGKILAETIIANRQPGAADFNRQKMEAAYAGRWEKQFAMRLKAGRLIQRTFGSNGLADLALTALKTFPAITKILISNTHGKPF